jgi:hypothetical protein
MHFGMTCDFTSTFFMPGMVSPDTTCKACGQLDFLLGCPATSGLAMVTNTPVSMVTRHAFSYVQPSAIRLLSVTLATGNTHVIPYTVLYFLWPVRFFPGWCRDHSTAT